MEELNNIEESTKSESWGFDKKIPITLILVVVAQIVTTTWGAAKLSATVENYGEKIAALEYDLDKFIDQSDTRFLRLTSHAEEKAAIKRELDYIEDEIDVLDMRVRTLESRRD
jgi:cell division protein FtsB